MVVVTVSLDSLQILRVSAVPCVQAYNKVLDVYEYKQPVDMMYITCSLCSGLE